MKRWTEPCSRLQKVESSMSVVEKSKSQPNCRMRSTLNWRLCVGSLLLSEEIKGLPPPKTHDHQMPLIPDVEPLRRQLLEQKNIIERMIREMLEAGIIGDSKSPYASPIVLVKKFD